jgi:hypothetical protein
MSLLPLVQFNLTPATESDGIASLDIKKNYDCARSVN